MRKGEQAAVQREQKAAKQLQTMHQRQQKTAKEMKTIRSELKQLTKLHNDMCGPRKEHKWLTVAKALGISDVETKSISKVAKHMHDTLSKDWEDSLTNKSELTKRLPRAVRTLLEHLFSCVRVNKVIVPVEIIIRHTFPVEEVGNHNLALGEIRKAVRSAVSERRLTDAKMLLTLALSSFGKQRDVQTMKRYFSHVEPVMTGSKVTFLKTDETPRVVKKNILCRNYSFESRTVCRGTAVSVNASKQTVKIKHYSKELERNVTTKFPMSQVHSSANIYVNEQLLLSAQQFKEYLGVGVPPVRTPSVQNAVISLEMLMHFISWIFSPIQTNTLKPRGNDGERGCTHQLKDYAARTWKDYRAHAQSKGIKGISQHNYNAMLKLPVFKRLCGRSVVSFCE